MATAPKAVTKKALIERIGLLEETIRDIETFCKIMDPNPVEQASGHDAVRRIFAQSVLATIKRGRQL